MLQYLLFCTVIAVTVAVTIVGDVGIRVAVVVMAVVSTVIIDRVDVIVRLISFLAFVNLSFLL